jgi:hypothetical protein
MGLLDFDDSKAQRFTPKSRERFRDNFSELQNMGHEPVAEDFSDMEDRIKPTES